MPGPALGAKKKAAKVADKNCCPLGACMAEAEGAGEGLPSKRIVWGFPGGAVVENPPANAGDTGSSPGLGRSHMPRSN